MNTAPGVQVLADLGGGWLQCIDAQGEFFFNQITSQSSDRLPPEFGGPMMGAAPTSVQATSTVVSSQVQGQVMMPESTVVSSQVVTAASLGGQPLMTVKLGDWEVWSDAQGEFYKLNGQTFDSPPEELAGILNSYRSAQGTGTITTLEPAWDLAKSYSTEPVPINVPTAPTATSYASPTAYTSAPAATSYASPTAYTSAPAPTSYASPQAVPPYYSQPAATAFAAPQTYQPQFQQPQFQQPQTMGFQPQFQQPQPMTTQMMPQPMYGGGRPMYGGGVL